MNEQLKQFRARWNLTQDQISQLLGVRQPAWHMWESGKRDVPEYVVKEISFFDRLSRREQNKELEGVREGRITRRCSGRKKTRQRT